MDIISQVIEEQREYFKCHRDGDYRVESPILTSDYPEGLHLNPKGKAGYSHPIFYSGTLMS